jgi:ABC-type glycerol-3-phosphate transport system substrate-binding protein
MGVNPQAADGVKEECFNYIQWHDTDPALMKARALGGAVPALRSLKSDPDILANPVVAAMLANMDRAVYYGVPPSGWEEGLAQITELMFVAQTASVDEALDEAQSMVDDVLDRAENVYWGFQERAYAHADEMHEP